MKGTPMLYLSIAVLMLVFFSAMPMYHASEGMQDLSESTITQPQSKVYINGDWNVTTDTVRSNETIILSGNLTVSNNATLTFRNVTLKVNSTSAQYYAIEVLDGAAFRIFDLDNDNTTTTDASVIERNNSSNPYFFRVYDGAVFEMRNSELHGCGDATTVVKYAGLYIETDNATIDHNLISNNYMGIVLYGSDATVSNNTITWNGDAGIFSGYWSNGTIENNWITWNYNYGIWITGIGNVNPKPSNPTVIGNVITDTGRGSSTAVGIQIEYSCNPLIKDTLILRSTEDGVYSGESIPTLINVTIDGENYGIATSTSGTVTAINCTIMNTKLWDVSSSDTHVYLINSSCNQSKISADNSGDVYIQWYLNVYVEDSNHQPIPAADVRVRDNENGNYERNFSTDSNGYVKWIVLTEYWQNSTTKIYYSPYNITVNYSGLTFIDNPRNSTINQSKTEVFIATTPVPEFPSIIFGVWGALLITTVILHRKRKDS